MEMSAACHIFLLPGFDGTGELFAPLQSALGDVPTTAVRYQQELEFDDYVDSVACLLAAQNAVLIAESFSGPVALALMARYPSRIKCAVLCATFAVSPFRSLARLAQFAPEVFFAPTHTSSILRLFCFDQHAGRHIVQKTLSVIRSVPAATIKSRLKMLADVDVRPLLSQINIPVLYLRARQDRIVGTQLGRQLIQSLSNVTVKEIDGPHLLLQARPVECAQVMVPFINSNIV